MRFVDRLRIRQVIALIVVLPMLVGSIAVGLLALDQNRSRTEALQELDDLDVLTTVRRLESALAAERAFYEGWTTIMVRGDLGSGQGLRAAGIRSGFSTTMRAVSDEAIGAVPGTPLTRAQRSAVDDLIEHWYALRAAFDLDDRVGLGQVTLLIEAALPPVVALAEEVVARQGPGWLAIERQSHFGVAMAEEMTFIGVLLGSETGGEANRRRAAVLTDRTQTAFAAMLEVSTVAQRERLVGAYSDSALTTLREQSQLNNQSMSFGEVIQAMTSVVAATDVVDDVRLESAETIRDEAVTKARRASNNRNGAMILAVVVVLGPLWLLIGVGGRLSRRLGLLAEAARRVSNGEMNVRIDAVTGRDEVAEVSSAFNEVAETIARSHDQISALAEGRIYDPILDDELPGVIGQTLRLALRRLGNATAELAHQANHDKLTGLLDRRGLQAGLDSLGFGTTGRHEDGATNWGMILVDLDDFKQINDVHGHSAGDAVIREMARRLVSGTRGGDLVARLGGDEFLILTNDVDACEATTQRLAVHISRPVEWSGLLLSVTASIGWTSVGVGEHFEEVLHRADTAMYTAKRSGKNRSYSG